MSFSVKLDLENRIFARAAFLHIEIYANGGRWCSSLQTDAYLNALLNVYNYFFVQVLDENELKNWHDFWRVYEEQGPFIGGVKNGWILPPVSEGKK